MLKVAVTVAFLMNGPSNGTQEKEREINFINRDAGVLHTLLCFPLTMMSHEKGGNLTCFYFEWDKYMYICRVQAQAGVAIQWVGQQPRTEQPEGKMCHSSASQLLQTAIVIGTREEGCGYRTMIVTAR